MHLLKVLVVLIVLVAVIEAQKGGTKTRQKPQSVPSPPAGRKTPPPAKPAPRQQPVPQRPAPQPQQPQEDEEGSAGNGIEENNEAIAEPPAVVPQTSFTCDDKPYQPGMYADMENECKSYHMCFDSRKESFLCGTGTMFNQEILSCDHEAKVNCANSPQYYEANTELGKPGAEPSGNQQPAPSGQSGQKGGAVAQPRPRVQKPQPSKSSPPKPAPRQQPQPSKPFQDDEQPEENDEQPEAPVPARPAPQPRPRPSKTSQPRPAPQPKKAPASKKTPIVQSYDSDDESESSNVRRAYRARY